jgi:hypothetical protein
MINMENGIIFLVFAAALVYLVRLVFSQFWGKNAGNCAKGCGTCAASTTIDKMSSERS